MNVVLDTNVLISATIFDDSEAQKLLFKLIRDGSKIFISHDILNEYKKVLKRDFEYNENDIDKILETILLAVNLIETNNKIEIIKEDPDDNMIIECAVSSNSDYIITYDQHLLNLKSFEKIKIVKPEEINLSS